MIQSSYTNSHGETRVLRAHSASHINVLGRDGVDYNNVVHVGQISCPDMAAAAKAVCRAYKVSLKTPAVSLKTPTAIRFRSIGVLENYLQKYMSAYDARLAISRAITFDTTYSEASGKGQEFIVWYNDGYHAGRENSITLIQGEDIIENA
jgi:hypothetical protein